MVRYASQSPGFRATCVRLAGWQSNLDYHRQVRRVAHEAKLEQAFQLEHPDQLDHPDEVVSSVVEPPPELSEKEATQRDAELLGEGIVLTVALGVLWHQYRQDQDAELVQDEKLKKNEDRIGELEHEIAALRQRLSASEAAVAQQQQQAGVSPSSASWWRRFGRG